MELAYQYLILLSFTGNPNTISVLFCSLLIELLRKNLNIFPGRTPKHQYSLPPIQGEKWNSIH